VSIKNIITAAVFILIFCISPLSAWEIDQSVGSNFAYYVDDSKGGSPGSSWFQLPSYVPKTPDESIPWGDGPYGTWGNGDPETRNLGSGWGSVELEGYYEFQAKTSFLAGNGPLTEGNNITFIVKPTLAPVTLHVETEVHWTPIAFLQLIGGVAGGFGWP